MVRAVLFDFNGTLSDDEPLLEALFVALAAEHGVRLGAEDYWREFAGLSDPAIARGILALAGEPEEGAGALLAEKVRRYREVAPPLTGEVVRVVRETAARVPIGIASGALRGEVGFQLSRAGVLDAFAAVVCAEDVAAGKPDPAGYVLALERLNAATGASVQPADALCVEDAHTGVDAARAAGMRSAALRRSPAYRGGADHELDALAGVLALLP